MYPPRLDNKAEGEQQQQNMNRFNVKFYYIFLLLFRLKMDCSVRLIGVQLQAFRLEGANTVRILR